MKPEQTITIPVPKYREDVRYYGSDGYDYYFTETDYSYENSRWSYFDAWHGKRFTEKELDEWIGEEERERVHAEEDRKIEDWQKKWIENNKRQNIMKEALK